MEDFTSPQSHARHLSSYAPPPLPIFSHWPAGTVSVTEAQPNLSAALSHHEQSCADMSTTTTHSVVLLSNLHVGMYNRDYRKSW